DHFLEADPSGIKAHENAAFAPHPSIIRNTEPNLVRRRQQISASKTAYSSLMHPRGRVSSLRQEGLNSLRHSD
ncbi:Hypothetical predicted protein, partial [Cloeon dipterum]